MEKFVFLMSGPPGSGKTTWIKNTMPFFDSPIHISRDEIRNELVPEGKGNMFSREKEVLKIFYQRINEAIENDINDSIFIDATHISEKARHQTISQLKNRENIYLICVQMQVYLYVSLARNENRIGRARVPRKVVKRMFSSLTNPCEDTSHHFDDVWFINSLGQKTFTFHKYE